MEPIKSSVEVVNVVENDPAAQFRLELVPSNEIPNNNGMKSPLEEKLEKGFLD